MHNVTESLLGMSDRGTCVAHNRISFSDQTYMKFFPAHTLTHPHTHTHTTGLTVDDWWTCCTCPSCHNQQDALCVFCWKKKIDV